ncbi:MAG: hypothetical protein R3B13_05865 [Polyangiaceae bacterium]
MPAPRIAVFDVLATGADPRLARDLTLALRGAAERRGYAPIPEVEVRNNPALTTQSGDLSPPAARRLVRALNCQRGVFASVGVAPGKYTLRLVVVDAEGELDEAKDAATPEAVFATATKLFDDLVPVPPRPEPRTPSQSTPQETRFPDLWLAFGTEGALGLSGAGFYNHLVHGRASLRHGHTSLGVELAYANLKGREGRAHNVLPSVVLEHALDLGAGWALPLSASPGYLPNNGPVFQAGAGVSYAFDPSTELSLLALAPTAWITKDQVVYSLDVGAELRFGL